MKLEPIEEKTNIWSKSGGSRFGGVSVRGWLALGLIGVVCFGYFVHLLAALSIAIKTGDLAVFGNPLLAQQVDMQKSLCLVAIGFYFKEVAEHFGKRKP